MKVALTFGLHGVCRNEELRTFECSIAAGYIEESMENKINIIRRIFNSQQNVRKQTSIAISSDQSTAVSREEINTSVSVSDFLAMALYSDIALNNLNNCTSNI